MELFGLRSTLPVYNDSDSQDTKAEPGTAGFIEDESPKLFPNVWVGCGCNIAFHPPGYGNVPVLELDDNGHALFPMHSACATIVQRVCASDNNEMTLQAYYDILRKACAMFLAEGGINWPHKHFGAMQYWAYDDWDYKDGFLKFVTDPLRSTDTKVFIMDSLETIKARKPKVPQHERRAPVRSSIETLPNEIMDQIVGCLPMDAIYSLRLASLGTAYKVPLDQRFFRERLLSGELLPYIWDLRRASCLPSQCSVDIGLEQTVKGECWDWRGLAQSLTDISGLVSTSTEESGLPRSLWNRLRIWQSVVNAEKWLHNDQSIVECAKGI